MSAVPITPESRDKAKALTDEIKPVHQALLRQANVKLTSENDRLSRLVDSQLTNVDSLMIHNTHLHNQNRKLLANLSTEKKRGQQLTTDLNTLKASQVKTENAYRYLRKKTTNMQTGLQRAHNIAEHMRKTSDKHKQKLMISLQANRELINTIDGMRNTLLMLESERNAQMSMQPVRYQDNRTALDTIQKRIQTLAVRIASSIQHLCTLINTSQLKHKRKQPQAKRQRLWGKRVQARLPIKAMASTSRYAQYPHVK